MFRPNRWLVERRVHREVIQREISRALVLNLSGKTNGDKNTAGRSLPLTQPSLLSRAAQQYIARKESDEGPSSILGILAAERVRATYQLCQSVSEDLKRPEIEVPAGSLIQLYEVMSALTKQLKGVVNRLG
jgi:hypothetical protein